MQIPLQITYRDMPHSDALDGRIREKAAKLEEFHQRVVSCRVTVEEIEKHKQRGKEFCVRLDIKVPQHEVAINRDHHKDVYVAMRDAFEAAYRKLEDIARVQREETRGRGSMRATEDEADESEVVARQLDS